jgi:hypothetical protein
MHVPLGIGQHCAGADAFQRVVKHCQRQVRVRCHAGFAVRVEFLRDCANDGELGRCGRWKWKRVEDVRLRVPRVVANTELTASAKEPCNVYSTLQNPKYAGV